MQLFSLITFHHGKNCIVTETKQTHFMIHNAKGKKQNVHIWIENQLFWIFSFHFGHLFLTLILLYYYLLRNSFHTFLLFAKNVCLSFVLSTGILKCEADCQIRLVLNEIFDIMMKHDITWCQISFIKWAIHLDTCRRHCLRGKESKYLFSLNRTDIGFRICVKWNTCSNISNWKCWWEIDP